MKVNLSYIDNDYAKHIEFASRASTNTLCNENPDDLVKKLVSLDHLSIGRHSLATFEVHCSLAASHQICRHPFLSIIQRSYRYTKLKPEEQFVVPSEIESNPDAKDVFNKIVFQNKIAYQELLNLGIKPESARYVLPVATETRLIVSSNFQGWIDVCSLRCGKKTMKETRDIFQEIFRLLCQKAPSFFSYFRKEDGSCKKQEWK